MGRTDFNRTPFARPEFDEDFIPAVVYPDEASFDPNSPDSEVRFTEDENSRRRSIYLDFHNNNGEQELEIVAGFNSVRRELLNEALKEKTTVHGRIRTLAVTMATQNARAHALFFAQNGFKRVADRSRTSWTYICDIEEQKLRKKERHRAKRVVDVKKLETPPVPALKLTMPSDEYQAAIERKAELDREIERLEAGLS